MGKEDKRERKSPYSERHHHKRNKSQRSDKRKGHHQVRSPSDDSPRAHHKKHSKHSYDNKYQKHEHQRQRNDFLPVRTDLSARQQIIKEMPCWEPSGILLKFYNSRQGIGLKFHEPPQGRTPLDSWKIYVFKGEQVFQPIELKNSCYLIGKDERICDILAQHPSISRQHAVLQFRLISKPNIDGTYTEVIKPYIMDLQSTNGTIVEEEKIPSSRYVELLHKDVIKFGFSEREYVIVHDETAAAERSNANQDDYEE